MSDSANSSTASSDISTPTIRAGKNVADQLLDLYEKETPAKASEIEKKAEEQLVVKETIEKKEAAKAVVESLPSASDALLESEVSEDAEGLTKESEGDKAASESYNIFADFEGKELEIPPQAELTYEVNGKPFKFKVEDAIKAKLSQEEFNRSMDRRLAFADQREKASEKRIESRISAVLDRAKEVIAVSQSGDILPAIRALAKMAAGDVGDPVEIERQFLENFDKVRNVWGEMNPVERAKYLAERRAEEAEKKAKQLEAQALSQNSMQQTAQEIKTICSEWGLSFEQFNGLYELIAENLVGEEGAKPFKSLEQVGPKEVIKVHHELTTQGKVAQALRKVDETLVDQQDLFGALYSQALQNPKWTVEDLEYIVKQVVKTPSKSVQNLNLKVERARTQRLNSALKEGSAAKKGDENSDLDQEWERKLSRSGWAARLK